MKKIDFHFVNETLFVSAKWHYASGTIAALCLIFGLISNGTVLLIFFRNSALRRPKNYFLINLALTDLGLLLTDNTMHIIASFQRRWPFGDRGCVIYAFFGGVFGLSSISTMAAIALVRLVVVITPLNSLKINRRFMIRSSFFCWFYGSIWIVPPFFGWNRFVFEGFGTSCTFDYFSKEISDRIFVLFLMIGGFVLPVSIIVTSYILILAKLVRRNENFNIQSSMIDLDQFSSLKIEKRRDQIAIFDLDEENPARKNLQRTKARATRTAILICLIFCLSWTPYSLLTCFSQFGFDSFVTPYTTASLALFAKTAACINPLIYALNSTIFRREIRSFFHRTSRPSSKVFESSSNNQISNRER